MYKSNKTNLRESVEFLQSYSLIDIFKSSASRELEDILKSYEKYQPSPISSSRDFSSSILSSFDEFSNVSGSSVLVTSISSPHTQPRPSFVGFNSSLPPSGTEKVSVID